ncbi:MAG TPA: RNA polymerase factor sigma-54 [Bacteroidia bacterium]|nr:RNA polymerase factor sigma-54 [Bacteroidia bacterium]
MANLRQTQQLKQQLKLTPNQILVQKLLLLPVALMEQRIKEEIENNPALEDITEPLDEPKDEVSDNLDEEFEKGNADDDYDAEEFMEENDEYVPAYKLSSDNYAAEQESRESSFADTSSFQDSLHFQLGLKEHLSERQQMLGDYIIGNIDEDGYLRRDLYSISNDITFQQNILTDEKELEPLLEIIQEFDPPGVGARDLRECLLIQLKREGQKDESTKLALEILEKGFEEFSKKNYDKLREIVKTDEVKLREAVNEIIKLNPKPGQAFADAATNATQVVPDFVIANSEGELEASINGRISNTLRLSPLYIEMSERKKGMDKMQREAASFAKTKIETAGSFINAIKQREDTLQRVMQTILNYQQEYFASGDEGKLKPMLLKDIAKETGLDISTISRVVSSKYVQTNFGTFLLKTLFSESFQKESGEEVSINEVKNRIHEIINAEDKKKPVNDDALVSLLEQNGYKVARRTVAKYREQLGIPVARMRKEI